MALRDVEEDEEYRYAKAVVVASLLAIALLVGLMLATHTENPSFTQLWLKSWRVNLSNATQTGWTGLPGANLTGTVLGHRFFVFKKPNGKSYQLVFESDLKRGAKAAYSEGDTIRLEENTLFLDSLDVEGRQVLFWEYPKTLQMSPREQLVRFCFVLENRLGSDHEYDVKVFTSTGNSTRTERVRLSLHVESGEAKECLVSFPLSREEVIPIISGAERLKVSIRLDTGEEVYFWLTRIVRR